MASNNLPDDIDHAKLAETALAILSLTLHDGGRVWRGLDWDLMDLLHEKGWSGLRKSFFAKYFGRRGT